MEVTNVSHTDKINLNNILYIHLIQCIKNIILI